MSVTFEGPIRVRRRNNSTNDGTAFTDDTGAVVATQQTTITFPASGEVPIAQLPSGACIENIRIFSASTVTAGGGNIAISLLPTGGTLTQIGTITFAATTAGALNVTLYQLGTNIAPTAAGAATWQNIGTVDARLSINTGLITGIVWYVSVTYTVRNADGSIIPYGSGATNNGVGNPVF